MSAMHIVVVRQAPADPPQIECRCPRKGGCTFERHFARGTYLCISGTAGQLLALTVFPT